MNSKTKTIFTSAILMFTLLINLISAVTIKDVSSSPGEIAPGEIADIFIKIENIFEENVQNLKVKLNLNQVPFAPYQSSSEEFLEELEEGEKKIFKFRLITLPETSSGIYKIPVEITYEYNEEEKIKEELISLTINSKPELKISMEDSVALIKGKENKFVLKIVNSGLSDAKFVYLETSDITGIKFITNKEQYIGDINSDDFDTIKYSIFLEADISDTINLPIVLRYKDSTNKEYTESKTLIARTYSVSEAQKLGLVPNPNYVISIIICSVVLLFIGYRIIRKRKRKKKLED